MAEWQVIVDAGTFHVEAWGGDLSNMRAVHTTLIESRIIPLTGDVHGLVIALAGEIQSRETKLSLIRDTINSWAEAGDVNAETTLSNLEDMELL